MLGVHDRLDRALVGEPGQLCQQRAARLPAEDPHATRPEDRRAEDVPEARNESIEVEADSDQSPTRSEQTSQCPMIGPDRVEHHVESACMLEWGLPIVQDLVRTRRPHEVGAPCARETCDMSTEELPDLHREAAGPTA